MLRSAVGFLSAISAQPKGPSATTRTLTTNRDKGTAKPATFEREKERYKNLELHVFNLLSTFQKHSSDIADGKYGIEVTPEGVKVSKKCF